MLAGGVIPRQEGGDAAAGEVEDLECHGFLARQIETKGDLRVERIGVRVEQRSQGRQVARVGLVGIEDRDAAAAVARQDGEAGIGGGGVDAVGGSGQGEGRRRDGYLAKTRRRSGVGYVDSMEGALLAGDVDRLVDEDEGALVAGQGDVGEFDGRGGNGVVEDAEAGLLVAVDGGEEEIVADDQAVDGLVAGLEGVQEHGGERVADVVQLDGGAAEGAGGDEEPVAVGGEGDGVDARGDRGQELWVGGVGEVTSRRYCDCSLRACVLNRRSSSRHRCVSSRRRSPRMQERVNTASIVVKLVAKADRNFSQFYVMDAAREELKDLTHVKTSVEIVQNVSGSEGGFESAAIQYGLQGQDLDKLDEASKKIMARMKDEGGFVDVNSSYDVGKPQVDVVPDRNKAADLGVTVRDIGSAVQTLVGGRRAGRFEEGGETYDVRVRLVRNDRNRPEAVLEVPVRNRDGSLVELRNLVDVDTGTGPVQIDREGRSRKLTVYANLDKGKALNRAMEDVEKIAADVGLPKGTETKFSGDAENMAESFANILFSLGLAVILIYMVLAAQFESLVHPFTIMLSLPLSIVGALGLLFLTGRTLNIFSMIGMIMLAGLVTKNAILLIDYTNLLRRQGVPKKDAILRAGPVRLRPILMTAMSTIAGMIPVVLGFGSGAETRAPMGTAIVGGMVTSTILTLIVIPVVYSLMDDIFSMATLNRLAYVGTAVFRLPVFRLPRRRASRRAPDREKEQELETDPPSIPLAGPHIDVAAEKRAEEMRHKA